MTRKMRRPRHEAPKVWHNPDVVQPRGSPRPTKQPAPEPPPQASPPSGARRGRVGKIVVRLAAAPVDPRDAERDRLVERLRVAEGRPAITRAAKDLAHAGFELPQDDQIVFLQLLEHSDEERVRDAISRLDALVSAEPVKRFTVLDSRLRRLEELADEGPTREAARALRRRVTGRPGVPAPE
jgi:hypothetical protein